VHPAAVVFDVGNVLYRWHPRYLYETLIDDSVELDRVCAIVMSDQWHWSLDKGRIFAEIAPGLIERFPRDADYIRAWGTRFSETIDGPIAGMAEIVAALQAGNVPIYAITNFPGEFWTPFRAAESALFDRFSDIIVSGFEGIAKPDPAIFRLARERFRLGEGEGLFIDDVVGNVRAAEAEGFAGHHFHDARTLRAALESLEIL